MVKVLRKTKPIDGFVWYSLSREEGNRECSCSRWNKGDTKEATEFVHKVMQLGGENSQFRHKRASDDA